MNVMHPACFDALQNYPSTFTSIGAGKHTFMPTSEHILRGSNEHVCAARWAALATGHNCVSVKGLVPNSRALPQSN